MQISFYLRRKGWDLVGDGDTDVHLGQGREGKKRSINQEKQQNSSASHVEEMFDFLRTKMYA